MNDYDDDDDGLFITQEKLKLNRIISRFPFIFFYIWIQNNNNNNHDDNKKKR